MPGSPQRRRPLGPALLRPMAALALLAATVLSGTAAEPAAAATGRHLAQPAVVRATVPAAAQTKTLAPTPPMGFNNWNAFGCSVSAQLIEQTADYFVSSGLKKAGYQYVNIDDCWALKDRGADGELVPDPVKFPDGIKGVADYVHALGLKLGIYGDAGTKTCAGYPGSLGHEEQDAKTWAGWGVDYLKYDNCSNQSDGTQADYIARYTAMRKALDDSGRPIVYSICEWGSSQPWTWAKGVGDLWRTGGDITDNWSSVRSIIAANAPLAPYAGPGHWNDPDMLEIGNGGMTPTEYRTHLSMWATMAAPLIIGTDLRTASAETIAMLENRDVIAVDQDRLGIQGRVVSNSGGLMVLDKPLANGDHAVALYNSTDALATVGATVADLGLKHAPGYRLTDLWTKQAVQAKNTISAAVPAHGTVLYRVQAQSGPTKVAPSVTVAAAVQTVIPAADGGTPLSTTVTNRGAGGIGRVQVTVVAPAGWTVTAQGPSSRHALKTDAALSTEWRVEVPAGTVAGDYSIQIQAAYTWGPKKTAGSSTSELVGTVVNGPPDGRRYLGSLRPVTSTNASGPVEIDQSNGGSGQNDGTLITIAGTYYTHGLGTSAPSGIRYFLDKKCQSLSTDVGIDDASASGSAMFDVLADDVKVASSGPVKAGDAAHTLTVDLSGAEWLDLQTSGDAGTATDWAVPVISCNAAANSPLQPAEHTLYGFEDGTDGFGPANADSTSAVATTTAFHTEGGHGLQVTTPADGNWFGKHLDTPIDLSAAKTLKFDVHALTSGATGEIAVETGAGRYWCQGGHWAWTNPGNSRTITEQVGDITCPLGTTLDWSDIRGIWVYLNGGSVLIDNVRAEE